MTKRRVILRLNPNEVAVVGRVDTWEHLVGLYEAFAEDAPPEYKPGWYEAADWIRSQIANYYDQEEEW